MKRTATHDTHYGNPYDRGVSTLVGSCLLHGQSSDTVEPDLIATIMLVLPSKPSRNKNYNDLMIVYP